MPGLALEDVSHRYDDTLAVDRVSLGVAGGEFVCLLGPSGCGKTTLLRLAAGLEHLQSGRIHISDRLVADGAATRQLPPEKRGVGLMFQDYALFPHLTVAENIRFGMEPAPDQRERARQALAEVHLEHVANRYPHTLSGGQQQRVALLRALAPSPGVMLLDEPFSGLDEQLRQTTRQETLALLKRTGVATLMVTHDPEEAMYLADRIVVLNRGRMVQDAAPVEIYERPADPFIARLFGPVNEYRGRVADGHVATPLGPISARGLGDGEPALVMVRADGVHLSGDHGLCCRVAAARPLGPASQIVLDIGEDEASNATLGPGARVEARVAGLDLPEPGSRLHVTLDPDRIFVFGTAR